MATIFRFHVRESGSDPGRGTISPASGSHAQADPKLGQITVNFTIRFGNRDWDKFRPVIMILVYSDTLDNKKVDSLPAFGTQHRGVWRVVAVQWS